MELLPQEHVFKPERPLIAQMQQVKIEAPELSLFNFRTSQYTHTLLYAFHAANAATLQKEAIPSRSCHAFVTKDTNSLHV